MALAIDASSPVIAVNSAGATATVTSASFTPPANSLLVILWSGDTATSTDPAAPTITDNLGVHLTYTLQVNEHRSSGTPALDGQAAIWTAPVGTSAAMTVTVTSGVSTSNKESALCIRVMTDTGQPGAGAAGGSRLSTPGNTIAQNFTATATGSWGFLAVCDWDTNGAQAAGTGCTLIGSANIGTAITYGFVRRTTADGVSGSATTMNDTLPASATNLHWAWLEVTPNAGVAGTPQPPQYLIAGSAARVAETYRSAW